MPDRAVVVGLLGFLVGALAAALLVAYGPNQAAQKVEDTGTQLFTGTRIYDIPRDLDDHDDPDAVVRATCKEQWCEWKTYEYNRFYDFYMDYQEDRNVRRGEVVEVETSGISRLTSKGFSEWKLVAP